ncbi:SWIM zinc finger family protein [Clostridium sp. C8-1-8]|uniref:SWIM zinc finger family protein n=1 Tax=Clostridium sp. C8-1-8 TaxID=2698831 RepID=UPI00136BD402|nr:SWIM zinc finger family protein [Clostridium sp. C8-1-8]
MWYYNPNKKVSAAESKAKAKKALEKLSKENPDISPVIIEGKNIATKWWGKAWNKNLESYADYSNRISRGRTYVKSGAVLDLKLTEGKAEAIVQGSGSNPYKVTITIDALDKAKWENIRALCNQKIDTLEALLAGSFPKELEEIFSASKNGLFPNPKEIHFSCSCPDSAWMCKHVAAVLYGIGNRLDSEPVLFFTLRNIDFQELLRKSMEEKMRNMLKNADRKSERVIDDGDVFGLFGV